MKILGDYHTHTIYSKSNHGKSTIQENVDIAKKKGLKEIAITDHGYGHIFYGVDKNKVENLKEEIKKANKDDIKVLYGIESNLLNFKGEIDYSDNFNDMDIILMGYHSAGRKYLFNGCFFHYFNYMARIFGTSKWLKNKNTQAYLKALDRYDIDIVTHLNSGVKVDVIKIAEKCIEKNVYIELNGRRLNFTKKEIDEMVKMGCKFIINSDAHICSNVAKLRKPMNFSIINQIPKELICNLDQIPKFKNHKNIGVVE